MSVGTYADPVVATFGSTDPGRTARRAAPRSRFQRTRHHRARCSSAPRCRLRRCSGPDSGGRWLCLVREPRHRTPGCSLSGINDGVVRGLARHGGSSRPSSDLAGFSGGAAFAGGLVLRAPSRFHGAAILYGTLPFDAGVPVDAGRLAHLPVFVAQGDQDRVIPAESLSRTWDYLLSESGRAHRGTSRSRWARSERGGGVGIGRMDLAPTGFHLSAHGARGGPRHNVTWPTLADGQLPARRGSHPDVSWTIPQQQLSDNAPVDLQERLATTIEALPGVSVEPSHISVPGARAFVLDDPRAGAEAFLVPAAGEFAHLHPPYDGSLHLILPVEMAADVVTKGWGRMHPWAGSRLAAGFVMVYGPRDENDLVTVEGIVAASHTLATSDGSAVK